MSTFFCRPDHRLLPRVCRELLPGERAELPAGTWIAAPKDHPLIWLELPREAVKDASAARFIKDSNILLLPATETIALEPAAEVAAGRREPAKGSPLKSVKAYQDEIRESADMNFTRWSARAIPDVWNDSGRTFEASGAFVDNWVNVRMDMLTESWLLED